MYQYQARSSSSVPGRAVRQYDTTRTSYATTSSTYGASDRVSRPTLRHEPAAQRPSGYGSTGLLPAGSGSTATLGGNFTTPQRRGLSQNPSTHRTGIGAATDYRSYRTRPSGTVDPLDPPRGADTYGSQHRSHTTTEFDTGAHSSLPPVDNGSLSSVGRSATDYVGGRSTPSSASSSSRGLPAAGGGGGRYGGSDSTGSGDGRDYGAAGTSSVLPAKGPADPPVGFRNVGNTCYMNSALQCVLHGCSDFILKLQREKVRHLQRSSSSSRFFSSSSSSSAALKDALVQLLENKGSTQSLIDVKSGVSRMNHEFVGARQNDGHEFTRELLHGIHKEINRIEGKPKYVEMKDIEGEPDKDAAVRWIGYSKTHDDSLVYDHFGGFLRSVTKCGACQNRSLVFDPFLDLSVQPAQSLIAAFAALNVTESVQIFKCERCKKKNVDSKRQTVVVNWPKTLVVHLKRFSASGRKDGSAVSFPAAFDETDLKHGNCIIPDGTRLPANGYRLSGIVMHHGSAGFGHYTAYVRKGSKWFECDDSSVTQTSESTVLRATSSAYLLFYTSDT